MNTISFLCVYYASSICFVDDSFLSTALVWLVWSLILAMGAQGGWTCFLVVFDGTTLFSTEWAWDGNCLEILTEMICWFYWK
jgi:hypothetical protein